MYLGGSGQYWGLIGKYLGDIGCIGGHWESTEFSGWHWGTLGLLGGYWRATGSSGFTGVVLASLRWCWERFCSLGRHWEVTGWLWAVLEGNGAPDSAGWFWYYWGELGGYWEAPGSLGGTGMILINGLEEEGETPSLLVCEGCQTLHCLCLFFV